jgi:hypothetical protein
VFAVPRRDDDEFGKIVGVPDIGQIPFMLDMGIPLNGPQSHGTSPFCKKIRPVGDDSLHEIPQIIILCYQIII